MKNMTVTAAGALCLFALPAKAEITKCTEIRSVPMTITEQGIYCLKKNLVTASDFHAIVIETNNVTIDLNGWKLGGAGGDLSKGANGIFAEGRKNITVRNGTIRGFHHAVKLEGDASSGHVLEDLKADGSTFAGLWIEGQNHIVRNNHVTNTGGSTFKTDAFGIAVRDAENVVVSGNVISDVFSVDNVHGFFLYNVKSVAMYRNSVFDMNTAARTAGVHMFDTLRVALNGNHFVNDASGDRGIYERGGAHFTMCIENVVRSYSDSEAGCDYKNGNHFN